MLKFTTRLETTWKNPLQKWHIKSGRGSSIDENPCWNWAIWGLSDGDVITRKKGKKKSWLILDSIKLRETVRTSIRIKKENYINENTLIITRETLNRRCSWKHRQNEDFDKYEKIRQSNSVENLVKKLQQIKVSFRV